MAQGLTYPVSAPGASGAAAEVLGLAKSILGLGKSGSSSGKAMKSFSDYTQTAAGQINTGLDPAVGSLSKAWQANQKELKKLNEEVRSGALFSKETKARMDNALSTLVEYGATQKQLEQGFDRINTVAEKYGVNQAVTSKALEKLADESENAEYAMAALGDVFKVQAIAGGKVEDIAKEMGQAFQGDTAILKRFDKQAQDAAKAIEDINDPGERAKRIQEELKGAMQRQNSVLGRLRASYQSTRQRLVSFLGGQQRVEKAQKLANQTFKAASVVAGAFGGVVGGLLTKGIKTFLGQNVRAERSVKQLKKAWDDTLYTLGGIVLGYGNASKAIDKVTGFLKDLQKTLEKHQETIQWLVKNGVKGMIFLVKWGAKGVLGFAALISGVVEGIGRASHEMTGVINEAAYAWATLQRSQGNITLNEFVEAGVQYKRIKESLAKGVPTFAITEKIAEAIGLVDELAEKGDALVDGFFDGKASTDKKAAGPRRRPGSGDGNKDSIKQAKDEARILADRVAFMGLINDKERSSTATVIGNIKARQAELELVKELQRIQGDPYSDPYDKKVLAKAQKEADALAAAARAQRLAMRDDNADFSPEVNAAIKQMERQTKLLNAQKQFYKEMGDAGVQAFADIAMSAGHAFGLMISGANGAGQSFTDGILGAMGLVVPVFQALGTTMLAANNFWGLGVILGAGVLAGLLAGAKQRLAPRTTSLGSTGASPGGRDGLLQRYRQDQEERRQQITINMHYGNDLVEKRQIEVNRRTQRLHEVRTRRVRG